LKTWRADENADSVMEKVGKETARLKNNEVLFL
jgi:hypothetical protein